MKRLKSPCNCFRRKRGQICKHLQEIGRPDGETFLGDRLSHDSSDSEMLIKRSNRRIKAFSPLSRQGNSDDLSLSNESPDQTVSKLIEVGKAVGINLENREDLLEKVVGNGVTTGLC
ncbi:hypothetical protein OSB04_024938 [Centaurea solstitialis]|uniref:Uncharacterized protein n=1 Tax=Centaurea solstitialis TaxID=347529 RepID=A0AA38SYT1_9ASTR|nr:hypothetical protein OSB04_024938 [Centaurea solstitialis]